MFILYSLDPKVSHDKQIHDKCMENIVAPKGHHVNLISPRNCKATESIHVPSEETEDTGTQAFSEIMRFSKLMSKLMLFSSKLEVACLNRILKKYIFNHLCNKTSE